MNEKKWHLRSDFQICYGDIPLARLRRGKNIRSPQLSLHALELLAARQRTHLQLALQDWLQEQIRRFTTLFSKPKSELRDIHLLLQEHLGYIPKQQTPKLSPKQRKQLRFSGLILGRKGLYHQDIYKTKYQSVRFLLHALWNDLPEIPSHPEQSICYRSAWPKGFGKKMGYTHAAGFWIRDDILDKIYKKKPNATQSISWLGLDKKNWERVTKVLGINHRK